MRMKKAYLWAIVLLSAGLIGGHMSGNQIRRDSVAAAEQQLGVNFDSSMVNVGEVSLHVVFAGPADGDPVILLHGYPEFWYAWRGPMAVLAKAGFRVIAPDQRGYNYSDKPADVAAYRLDKLAGDVVGLAESLGYDEFFLAGHDFGGQVAWWTLLLHPERVRKSVIINKEHPLAATDYEPEEDEIDWYSTFLQIPFLPGYVGRLGNWMLLEKTLRATSLPNTFPDADLDQFRSAWDNDGAIDSMGKWYRANRNFQMDVGAGRISTPTMMIIAADDTFTPSDLARRNILFLNNGLVSELDTGTHWVIQEKSDLIGGSIAEFFSSLD
ncbi:MAG TPA: alpha/beta hydrolase [Parvularcula sp.]|jgi:epoxide hydrolase 4|nr:alpha/beta hydrolase [Parvularcula sp.]